MLDKVDVNKFRKFREALGRPNNILLFVNSLCSLCIQSSDVRSSLLSLVENSKEH